MYNTEFLSTYDYFEKLERAIVMIDGALEIVSTLPRIMVNWKRVILIFKKIEIFY